MEDMTKKLQSLLSDPESMQNLAELAQMLRQDGGDTQNAPPQQNTQGNADDTQSAAPPFDIAKLMAAAQALGQMQQQDDNIRLLLALRPHLSPERAKRTDKAVKMLRLYAAAGVLRENGLMQELLGDGLLS